MIDFKGLLSQANEQLKTSPGLSGGLAGGLAGGLLAGLLGSKGGRKMAGKALTYGGMAALGGIAYKAWQNYQQGTPAAEQGSEIEAPTPESGFLPDAGDTDAQAQLGMLLLRAMIAAAKADGHIDNAENARIFEELNRLDLSPQEKAQVLDEFSRPASLDAVIAGVTTPQQATEVYAASALIIADATAAEKQYLDDLARRLKLEPGLTQQIHSLVTQAR